MVPVDRRFQGQRGDNCWCARRVIFLRSTRRERVENESRTRREDGQCLLCGCYARVHSEAELEINNPCYKVFGHAEDIDYVACSTHTKPVSRL